MGYKCPYIADKKMYAAVMGACKWIRESGYFNKAVQYYADRYGVDEDELAKHIRARQAAGQKGKTGRKYYWFAVEYSLGNERNGCDYFVKEWARYTVAKGVSESTVTNRLSEKDDDASEYAPAHWFGRVEKFETKEAAQAAIRDWELENR